MRTVQYVLRYCAVQPVAVKSVVPFCPLDKCHGVQRYRCRMYSD